MRYDLAYMIFKLSELSSIFTFSLVKKITAKTSEGTSRLLCEEFVKFNFLTNLHNNLIHILPSYNFFQPTASGLIKKEECI
jgi:hypothetical protein